jgi:hypothetical protein
VQNLAGRGNTEHPAAMETIIYKTAVMQHAEHINLSGRGTGANTGKAVGPCVSRCAGSLTTARTSHTEQ